MTRSSCSRFVAELPRRAVILLVRVYQVTLSGLLGGNCRFVPTCSRYFIDAVEQHGVLRGSFMGLRRILHCHPLSGGGYDPVD